MDNQRTAAIRQAVATGEYERALHLWNDYATQLRQQLSSGSLSRAEIEEAGRIVAWSREITLCARARVLDELNSLCVAAQYAAPELPEAPRLVRINV
jgi:hypothetical protein